MTRHNNKISRKQKTKRKPRKFRRNKTRNKTRNKKGGDLYVDKNVKDIYEIYKKECRIKVPFKDKFIDNPNPLTKKKCSNMMDEMNNGSERQHLSLENDHDLKEDIKWANDDE